jgi:hypothetical protein
LTPEISLNHAYIQYLAYWLSNLIRFKRDHNT